MSLKVTEKKLNFCVQNKISFRSLLRSILIIFSLIISVPMVSSCGKDNDHVKIDISDKIRWNFADEKSLPQDTESMDFYYLEKIGKNNLCDIAGSDGKFLWLKIDFDIPDELKNKDLGLVIPYLHFADKLWINGIFSGGYGEFPPDYRSAQYECHFYSFPKEVLRQNSTNTVLIKVYALGFAEISGKMFISDYDYAKKRSEIASFFLTKFYMFFEGGMFCAFCLFFLVYIHRRFQLEYGSFAFINLSSLFFIIPFFYSEVPHGGMPYLWFIKLFLCIGCYSAVFGATTFCTHFLHINLPKHVLYVRVFILIFCVILTLVMPDYTSLMKITPYAFLVCVLSLIPAIYTIIKDVAEHKNAKIALTLLGGFTPVLLCLVADFIINITDTPHAFPYFTVFGWQGSIICFIFILAGKYNKVFLQNEYLNEKLEHEVEVKTQRLSEANAKLKHDMYQAEKDLDMAKVVQEKFFASPNKVFPGWDISILFSPLAKVSGDLYDYYTYDEKLKGFSLFDVSGHGIAASLLTMLSKNIIAHEFEKGIKTNDNVSSILSKINTRIIQEKGDVDNYMTGLLFAFDDTQDKEKSAVHFANAGHPYPILYKEKTKLTSQLMPQEFTAQYGVIGAEGIDVSFVQNDVEMEKGDILVCYTDGLTESTNAGNEQFGFYRVQEAVRKNAELSAREILKKIVESFDQFVLDNPRQDDITVIVLKKESPDDYVEEL